MGFFFKKKKFFINDALAAARVGPGHTPRRGSGPHTLPAEPATLVAQ